MRKIKNFFSKTSLPLFSLLFLAGCWQTIRTSFFTWGADGDLASAVNLWNGLLIHGFSFFDGWKFPIDNWILSLILPECLIALPFGETPKAFLLIGAGVCIANALLCAFLAWRLASPRLGLLTAAILVFPSLPAIGGSGFLTYPQCHSVTLFWGMLSFLAFLFWIEKKSFLSLFFATFCLSIASDSDPWAIVVFSLPLLASFSLLFLLSSCRWQKDSLPAGSKKIFQFPKEGISFLYAAIAVLISILFYKTHAFGLLNVSNYNAPFTAEIKLETISRNLTASLYYITTYLNLIPFSFPYVTSPFCYQEVTQTPPFWAVCLNGAVFFILLGIAFLSYLRNYSRLSLAVIFTASFCLLSIAAIFSVHALIGVVVGMETARYIVNIFYFFPLFLLLSPVAKNSKTFQAVLSAVLTLYLLSSFISNIGAYKGVTLKVNVYDTPALAKILNQEGVFLAYAPYWKVKANAASWVTNGRTTLYPVEWNPSYHGFVLNIWSHEDWYKEEKVHAKTKKWAFIIPEDRGYCTPFTDCLIPAKNQYGSPAKIIPYHNNLSDFKILIYKNQPLPDLPRPKNDAVALKALAFQGEKILTGLPLVTLNKPILPQELLPSLKKETTRTPMVYPGYSFGDGWSPPENWGIWSIGHHSDLYLNLPAIAGDEKELVFQTTLYLPPAGNIKEENLTVSLNNKPVTVWHLIQSAKEFTLTLPREMTKTSEPLKLSFDIPHTQKVGTDKREFGLGMTEFEVVKPQNIKLNQPVSLSTKIPLLKGYALGNGWSFPENWGIWGIGRHSDLYLNLPHPLAKKKNYIFETELLLPEGKTLLKAQSITVSIQNKPVRIWNVTQSKQIFRLTLPQKEISAHRRMKISFSIPHPQKVPTADPRIFGIGMTHFVIRKAP